jgi:hypothetical protein
MEENVEFMDCLSAEEDGIATLETNNSAAKADIVSVEIGKDKYDPLNWSDLLDNKMTVMLVERGPVHILGTDYDFYKE